MKKLISLYFLLFSQFLFAQVGLPEKWKNLLQQVVEVNSSTSHPEGVDKVRGILIPEFEKLGFTTKVIELKDQHKVLYFSLPESKPQVLMIGHVDTVFEKESEFQKFSEDNFSVKGPGVNDMKGGILMMLMILEEIKSLGLLNSMAVVLNDDEEIGSPFSASTLKEIARGIPVGLVYEPTLTSPEHVTTTQAGVEWLEIKVKGQASHAGAEHEKGINACVELAHKISLMPELTDYKKHLTINPGVIQGGTKPNVVCEEASVKIDVRFVDDQDLKKLREKLFKIVRRSRVTNKLLKRGTESNLVEIVHIPSLPHQSTDVLFQMGEKVAQEMGFKLKREHMGGASDANQLAPTGMKLLAGLGPWGTGAHSTNEIANKASFETRKVFSVKLIQEILRSNP